MPDNVPQSQAAIRTSSVGRRRRKWVKVHEYEGTETLDAEPSGPVASELTEQQLLLLCPDALAYALKHKQWSEAPWLNAIKMRLIFFQSGSLSTTFKESISNPVITQEELKTIRTLSNRYVGSAHCASPDMFYPWSMTPSELEVIDSR
jgi:hypothetical protein